MQLIDCERLTIFPRARRATLARHQRRATIVKRNFILTDGKPVPSDVEADHRGIYSMPLRATSWGADGAQCAKTGRAG